MNKQNQTRFNSHFNSFMFLFVGKRGEVFFYRRHLHQLHCVINCTTLHHSAFPSYLPYKLLKANISGIFSWFGHLNTIKNHFLKMTHWQIRILLKFRLNICVYYLLTTFISYITLHFIKYLHYADCRAAFMAFITPVVSSLAKS